MMAEGKNILALLKQEHDNWILKNFDHSHNTFELWFSSRFKMLHVVTGKLWVVKTNTEILLALVCLAFH